MAAMKKHIKEMIRPKHRSSDENVELYNIDMDAEVGGEVIKVEETCGVHTFTVLGKPVVVRQVSAASINNYQECDDEDVFSGDEMEMTCGQGDWNEEGRLGDGRWETFADSSIEKKSTTEQKKRKLMYVDVPGLKVVGEQVDVTKINGNMREWKENPVQIHKEEDEWFTDTRASREEEYDGWKVKKVWKDNGGIKEAMNGIIGIVEDGKVSETLENEGRLEICVDDELDGGEMTEASEVAVDNVMDEEDINGRRDPNRHLEIKVREDKGMLIETIEVSDGTEGVAVRKSNRDREGEEGLLEQGEVMEVEKGRDTGIREESADETMRVEAKHEHLETEHKDKLLMGESEKKDLFVDKRKAEDISLEEGESECDISSFNLINKHQPLTGKQFRIDSKELVIQSGLDKDIRVCVSLGTDAPSYNLPTNKVSQMATENIRVRKRKQNMPQKILVKKSKAHSSDTIPANAYVHDKLSRCLICSFQHDSNEGVTLTHEVLEHGVLLLKCIEGNSVLNLDASRYYYSSVNRMSLCRLCGAKSKSVHYIRHLKLHLSLDRDVERCEYCTYKATGSIRKHMKMHSAQRQEDNNLYLHAKTFIQQSLSDTMNSSEKSDLPTTNNERHEETFTKMRKEDTNSSPLPLSLPSTPNLQIHKTANSTVLLKTVSTQTIMTFGDISSNSFLSGPPAYYPDVHKYSFNIPVMTGNNDLASSPPQDNVTSYDSNGVMNCPMCNFICNDRKLIIKHITSHSPVIN